MPKRTIKQVKTIGTEEANNPKRRAQLKKWRKMQTDVVVDDFGSPPRKTKPVSPQRQSTPVKEEQSSHVPATKELFEKECQDEVIEKERQVKAKRMNTEQSANKQWNELQSMIQDCFNEVSAKFAVTKQAFFEEFAQQQGSQEQNNAAELNDNVEESIANKREKEERDAIPTSVVESSQVKESPLYSELLGVIQNLKSTNQELEQSIQSIFDESLAPIYKKFNEIGTQQQRNESIDQLNETIPQNQNVQTIVDVESPCENQNEVPQKRQKLGDNFDEIELIDLCDEEGVTVQQQPVADDQEVITLSDDD